MSDLTDLEAELDADFAIALARSEALRRLVEFAGREPVRLSWRMGWINGKQKGLEQAQAVISGVSP